MYFSSIVLVVGALIRMKKQDFGYKRNDGYRIAPRNANLPVLKTLQRILNQASGTHRIASR